MLVECIVEFAKIELDKLKKLKYYSCIILL